MQYMKTVIWPLLLVILVFTACDEPPLPAEILPPQATNPATVYGTVTAGDPYAADTNARPLANAIVYIRPATADSLNPAKLKTIMTDSMGNYHADSLDSGKAYILTVAAAVQTAAGKINYTARAAVQISNAGYLPIRAVPDAGAPKGLVLLATDLFGGRIAGATLILYTSRVLAQKDTGYSGAGQFMRKETDISGRALFTGILPDSLFCRARFIPQPGDTLKGGIKIILPGAALVTRDTVRLQ